MPSHHIEMLQRAQLPYGVGDRDQEERERFIVPRNLRCCARCMSCPHPHCAAELCWCGSRVAAFPVLHRPYAQPSAAGLSPPRALRCYGQRQRLSVSRCFPHLATAESCRDRLQSVDARSDRSNRSLRGGEAQQQRLTAGCLFDTPSSFDRRHFLVSLLLS